MSILQPWLSRHALFSLLAVSGPFLSFQCEAEDRSSVCVLTKKNINNLFDRHGLGEEFFSVNMGHNFLVDKPRRRLYLSSVEGSKMALIEYDGDVQFERIVAEGADVYLGEDGEVNISKGFESGVYVFKGGKRVDVKPNEGRPKIDVQGRYFVREFGDSGNEHFQVLNAHAGSVEHTGKISDYVGLGGHVGYVESTRDSLYLLFYTNRERPSFTIVSFSLADWKIEKRKDFTLPAKYSSDDKMFTFLIDTNREEVFSVVQVKSPFYYKKNVLLRYSLDKDYPNETGLNTRGGHPYEFAYMEPKACKVVDGFVMARE